MRRELPPILFVIVAAFLAQRAVDAWALGNVVGLIAFAAIVVVGILLSERRWRHDPHAPSGSLRSS